MQINNVTLFNGSTVNIGIAGDKIHSITVGKSNNSDPFKLNFDNAIAFPGLINSHDHLDFNLFPQLGNQAYTNYTQWGKYIHENHKDEIEKVLKIPEALRTSWGIYKNLLGGVTTVVNHGKQLKVLNPVITVIQTSQNLHSVKFEKYWKLKLNNPLRRNSPCVIHAGEGTDVAAEREIDELIKWNFFNRKIIAVHGVMMNEQKAKNFEALIWCPVSNYFLLNRTADINELKSKIKVCFGTDSTLTANWNIWQHIKTAGENNDITEAELFKMLTSNPADIWKLNTGYLEGGKEADIVVAKQNSQFLNLDPQDILLVIHQGHVRLFDESLLQQLKKMKLDLSGFYKIKIKGINKYIHGALPRLIKEIQKYIPAIDFPVS